MIWEPCSIFSTSLKLIQHQEWIQVPSSVFLKEKVYLSTCLCESTGLVVYRSSVVHCTGLEFYRSSGLQVEGYTGLVVYRSSGQ